MKRIFSMFLAAMLFFCMTVTAMAESFQMNTDKESISAGENVTVTVMLNEQLTGSYRSVQGQLKYDTEILTYVSHEMGEKYAHYSAKYLQNKEYFTFSNVDLTASGFSEIPKGIIVAVVFKTKKDIETKQLDSRILLNVSIQDINGNTEKKNSEIAAVICSEAKALAEAKAEAKKEIAEYKDTADYREAQQAELTAAIEKANEAIDAAEDKTAVDTVVETAKVAIDKIKTDAQLDQEEAEAEAKALAEAKAEAKKEIAEYKDTADYREAQQTELTAAIEKANEAIDAAEDKTAVDTAVETTKAAIDKIKTDAELDKEEAEAEAKALAEAKTTAKKEIAEYKDVSEYREVQQTELAEAIGKANEAIDAATSKEAVAKEVAVAKAIIDKIKTDAELDKEEAEKEHIEVIDSAVPPTCTESGLSEGKHCSVCGKVLVKQEVIPAAHTWKTTHELDKRATITEDGSRSIHCSKCDAKKDVKVIPKVATVELSSNNHTYNGKEVAPKVIVKDINGIIISSNNYDVSIPNGRINAGKYTYVVTFKNDYEGEKELTLTINPAKLTTVGLSCSSYTYNGYVKTPTVTAKAGSLTAASKRTTDSTSVDLTYSKGRKNVGTYKVIVEGRGNYTGTLTKTFNINPKGTSISKLINGKKSFTVKWKKQTGKMATSRITGYQYRYSTSSKMTSAKTKTVAGYAKTSAKKTGLKAKKKYYVQVRTYKKVNGKTYYSAWSKYKTVKTK